MLKAVAKTCGDDRHIWLQGRNPGWVRGIPATVMPDLQQAVGCLSWIAQIQQVALLDGQGIAHEPQFPVPPMHPQHGRDHVGVWQGEGASGPADTEGCFTAGPAIAAQQTCGIRAIRWTEERPGILILGSDRHGGGGDGPEPRQGGPATGMVPVGVSEHQVHRFAHAAPAQHPGEAAAGPGPRAGVDEGGVASRHAQQQGIALADVHGFQGECLRCPPCTSESKKPQG